MSVELQTVLAWGGFLVLVMGMLALDLFVLHRRPHEIHWGEALIGALVPAVMAMIFLVGVYYAYEYHWLDLGTYQPPRAKDQGYWASTGWEAATLFFTAYLVELSLSVDNIFLFIVLMVFFKVPRSLQHRVLFWGVVGALVMRGAMIGTVGLLMRMHWVLYLFGALLIVAGIKMLRSGAEESDPSRLLAVRLARRFLPLHPDYHGQRFFTRIDGKTLATNLFLVLVCIEVTDLIFAVDSIPAVFGITQDTFLVFSSNVFAILGLRSMYFLLVGVIDKFHLLKYGLALVLAFVGVKMLLPGLDEVYGWMMGQDYDWQINKHIALAVVAGLLTTSVVASLIWPKKAEAVTKPNHEASSG